MLSRRVHLDLHMLAGNPQSRIPSLVQGDHKLIAAEYPFHHVLNAAGRHQTATVHNADAVTHLGKFG